MFDDLNLDQELVDAAQVQAATMLADFYENRTAVVSFLDYPIDRPDHEPSVRQWVTPQVEPLAAYMRKLAKQWDEPIGELTDDQFLVALVDDMFRDGTMAMVYQKISAVNQDPHTSSELQTALSGGINNPYDTPVLPSPLIFKLKQIDWWEHPQMTHIRHDLEKMLHTTNLIETQLLGAE